MGTRMKRVKEITGDHANGLNLREVVIGIGIEKWKVAAHSYASGTTDWTLNDDENQASVLAPTLAGGAVNAIVALNAGKMFIVLNLSGQALTVKGASGNAIVVGNGKTATVMVDAVATNIVRVTADATYNS